MAYTLKFPAAVQIHPTFHVSQLKLFKGVLPKEPHVPGWMQGKDADTSLVPVAVLDRKLVKKENRATVMFLVQREGQNLGDASWEDAEDMERKFLNLAIWTG